MTQLLGVSDVPVVIGHDGDVAPWCSVHQSGLKVVPEGSVQFVMRNE